MHPCSGNMLVIGWAVVHYDRAARAFNAGIKYLHCTCSKMIKMGLPGTFPCRHSCYWSHGRGFPYLCTMAGSWLLTACRCSSIWCWTAGHWRTWHRCCKYCHPGRRWTGLCGRPPISPWPRLYVSGRLYRTPSRQQRWTTGTARLKGKQRSLATARAKNYMHENNMAWKFHA